MKRDEYKCYRCMIVETKVLLNHVKSTDYITCSRCGEKSKRISSKSFPPKYSASPQEFKKESR